VLSISLQGNISKEMGFLFFNQSVLGSIKKFCDLSKLQLLCLICMGIGDRFSSGWTILALPIKSLFCLENLTIFPNPRVLIIMNAALLRAPVRAIAEDVILHTLCARLG